MSIAEKLTTIAENQQKVYDAGKQAEYDRFWDLFQQNGTRVHYNNAFVGSGWVPDLLNFKYDLRVVHGGSMFFDYGNDFASPPSLKQILADAGVSLDFTKTENLNNMFGYSAFCEIGELDLSTALTSWTPGLFDHCKYLKTIDKLILPPNTTFQGWFSGCAELENLTIEGTIKNDFSVSDSPKLTHTSIMSIINCLETKTSGTFTCSLGATNLAKLTNAEKAIATGKGWTLA